MQALQRLAQLLARSPPAVLLQPQPLAFLALRDTALPVIKEHQRRLRCSPWCLHAAGPPSSDDETQRKALVNRMLYRSRQRGFLELDLLIGMWAEREVPRMSVSMIRELEVVLDQENPDMFKWLTGQTPSPPELQRNAAFAALAAHVRSLTDKHHRVPQAAGQEPKEWVRGWSDSGKELTGGGPEEGSRPAEPS